MKLINIFFIATFFCGIFHGVAQQKFEREYRVDLEKIPQNAQKFIAKCNFKKRVKWFAEESQDGKTFEAKVIKNGHKLSIEFDENGKVLDVEKSIKIKHIEPDVKSKIRSALKRRFKRYKLKKIQEQWLGSAPNLINYINGKENHLKPNLYEIIVEAKETKEFYEIIISREGKILKELNFNPRYFDNLEY